MGIPEPSEEDLSYAEFLVEDYRYLGLSEGEKKLTRVIAHLIRNGAVLAKVTKYRNIPDDYIEGERAAIALFEKLKEVCGA